MLARRFIYSAASRFVRVALTLALIAWVSVGDLNLTSAAGNPFGRADRHLQSSRLARVVQSFAPVRTSARQLQNDESESESDSEKQVLRVPARPQVAAVTADQCLAIIPPDHLFELPGTPPPALQL
jgi:hypothetical protein